MSEQGILSFALGLEAGGFLGPLGKATDGAKAFLTAMLGIGGAVEGFKAAIEKGAGLEQLHKRTGETVATLYQLEKGFDAAGLSGDDVSLALFKMEQSLGGVNEIGEHTDDIFRRLGLNLHALRHEDGATAMREILGSFGGLNQSGGASASMSIFGRGVGAEMLQLSRSGKEFADGMQHAAAAAKTFDQNAQTFDNLKTTFDQLKDKGMEMFAAIAASAAPALQRFADFFNGLDFTRLGNAIGEVIRTIEGSIEQGRFAELFGAALKAGAQEGSNYLLASLAGVFEAVKQMAKNSLVGTADEADPGKSKHPWKAGGIFAAQAGMAVPGAFDLLLAGFGFTPAENRLAANLKWQTDMDAKRRELLGLSPQAHSSLFGNLNGSRSAMAEGFAAVMGAAQHDQTDELKKLYSDIHNSLTPLAATASSVARGSGDGSDITPATGYHPSFTAIEKMGFVMTGLNNPFNSPQQETARNTAHTVRLLQSIAEVFGQYQKINGGYPFGQLNQPF